MDRFNVEQIWRGAGGDPEGICEGKIVHSRAREDGGPGWTFGGGSRRALSSRGAVEGHQFWSGVGGRVRYGGAGCGEGGVRGGADGSCSI